MKGRYAASKQRWFHFLQLRFSHVRACRLLSPLWTLVVHVLQIAVVWSSSETVENVHTNCLCLQSTLRGFYLACTSLSPSSPLCLSADHNPTFKMQTAPDCISVCKCFGDSSVPCIIMHPLAKTWTGQYLFQDILKVFSVVVYLLN